jgi:predicted nuclease with TOPRIM domain
MQFDLAPFIPSLVQSGIAALSSVAGVLWSMKQGQRELKNELQDVSKDVKDLKTDFTKFQTFVDDRLEEVERKLKRLAELPDQMNSLENRFTGMTTRVDVLDRSVETTKAQVQIVKTLVEGKS